MRSPSPKNAFTLIEILVVVAILGILAVLIVPAMQTARQKAAQGAAISNLRGIGGALMNYATDNSENFPLARDDIPYKTGTNAVISWQQQLDPYIDYEKDSTETDGTRKIFTLPKTPGLDRWGRHAFFLGSYAAQAANGGSGFAAVNRLKIQRPTMHILGGEQGLYVGAFSDTDSDKDDYGDNDPAFGGGDKDPKRVVQILFADGHVAGFTAFDKTRMTVRYEGVNSNNFGYNYGEAP